MCERFEHYRSRNIGSSKKNSSHLPEQLLSALEEEDNEDEARNAFVDDSLLCDIEKANVEGRIRPSVTVPLWKIAGYAAGTGSRFLNSSAVDGILSLLVTDACEDGIRRVVGAEDGNKGVTSEEKEMLKFILKKQRDNPERMKLVDVMEQVSGPLNKAKGQRMEGLKAAFRGVCRIPERL